jgi:hypothetical protein
MGQGLGRVGAAEGGGSGGVGLGARLGLGGLAAFLMVAGLAFSTAQRAQADEPKFPEVGRVPLFGAPASGSERSGWLVLDPAARRGYQLSERRYSIVGQGVVTRTTVQSFDLDSLQPRRRVELAGLPVTGGPADAGNVNNVTYGGEVVHAVDPGTRRIYLALSQPQEQDQQPGQALATTGTPVDGQRPLARFVALDEDALDHCGGEAGCPFAASFREPLGQEKLHQYWVEGMTVTRHYAGPGEAGRLVALFAQPQPHGLPLTTYDHTLAQWDPGSLAFRAGDEFATDPDPTTGLTIPAQLAAQQVAAAGPTARLEACAGAPLASISAFGQGNYQWGVLATREAVWTACQGAAGGAVRVALDGRGNLPLAGGQDPPYRLAQNISDVLVDEGGERLLIRSFSESGHTWWVFDTALRRYTGAIAAKATGAFSLAAGIDSATGRLYQQMEDYFTGNVPIRGGFSYSDTRLDPAPAPENVRPELAYPAVFSIRSDPVTRRVFVRLGHLTSSVRYQYPDTHTLYPARAEPFYRVLQDNVPIAKTPPPPDDSIFTTDVKEAPGLTQASYLGSGSSYGSRVLLIGGYQKAGIPTCGADDREYLIGSVKEASVSELSREAAASSMDADPRTQADTSNANLCRLGFEFDKQNNQTHSPAPDGINDYLASCLNDGDDSASPSARQGFSSEAQVTCDPKQELVKGSATGSFAIPGQIAVGYSHSEVTVQRDPLKGGVTVKVFSEAKNIEIPGFGVIGQVKAEATSQAAGRLATAQTTYKRTVCKVVIPGHNYSDCLTKEEQDDLSKQFEDTGRGEIRFKDPDPAYAKGSRSGYQATIQRNRLDNFQDQRISRDNSLALPGMELVFYQGDSGAGVGRQFFQFAGAQAATSYGISCLYGQSDSGGCNTDSFTSAYGDLTGSTSLDTYAAPSFTENTTYLTQEGPGASHSAATRIIQRIKRFAQRVGEGLLLALSSPIQGALVASVWALLYLPHYLGARRRLLPGAGA